MDGSSFDGCFLDGCFLDDYFLDSYFLNGCFLDGCFLDGCSLDGCLLHQKLQQNSPERNWMPEHFWATTSCHRHSTLVSQACEGLHQLWALSWHKATFLFECSGIQFFNLHSHVTYETPCHARDHPHPCLWKQTISLGVVIILGICLCSHTYNNSQNIWD